MKPSCSERPRLWQGGLPAGSGWVNSLSVQALPDETDSAIHGTENRQYCDSMPELREPCGAASALIADCMALHGLQTGISAKPLSGLYGRYNGGGTGRYAV